MLTVKVRIWIGKEWDLLSWDGNMWLDPLEMRDTEPHILMSLLYQWKKPLHPCLRRLTLNHLRKS